PDRLERGRDVHEPVGRAGGAKQRLRAAGDRVRLAVEPRRRDGVEAALVTDRAAGEPVLARELAQVPLDRGSCELPVESDRREGADAAVEPASRLGLLVVRDEQRGRALAWQDG